MKKEKIKKSWIVREYFPNGTHSRNEIIEAFSRAEARKLTKLGGGRILRISPLTNHLKE